MKIKKGDTVYMQSGKDRGKTAKVLRVDPKENLIVAEGMNLKKKHMRPKAQGRKGEVVQIPMPFRVSVALLVCPSCKKPTRLGVQMIEGRKMRVCKKCQAPIG
jgi:large subunit ribosomal protein L24